MSTSIYKFLWSLQIQRNAVRSRSLAVYLLSDRYFIREWPLRRVLRVEEGLGSGDTQMWADIAKTAGMRAESKS
jgi:hypothetical protein